MVQRLFNQAEDHQRRALADLIAVYHPILKSFPHAGKIMKQEGFGRGGGRH